MTEQLPQRMRLRALLDEALETLAEIARELNVKANRKDMVDEIKKLKKGGGP